MALKWGNIMEINKYTVEFNAKDVAQEISELCRFLEIHFQSSKFLNDIASQSAIKRLDDYLFLMEGLLTIDHYRLNRGDLLLRRAHVKDCEDCDYIFFNGVYFKVVLYL